MLVLLNVITGVFLNSAMQTAEDDKVRQMIYHIKRLFAEGDFDGSGQISLEEFELWMDHPQMQLYLRSIDLLPDEAEELFHLLDRDSSGEISLSEFVHGIMRLRGNAKAVDFAVFAAAQERHFCIQLKHMQLMENFVSSLSRSSI